MIPKLLFILFFLFATVLYPQVHIISENIQGNTYSLVFESVENYVVRKIENRNVLEFPLIFDESKPGSFDQISSDIFIAIPANSKPRVELNPVQVLYIEALPTINPLTERKNNNEIYYSDNLNSPIYKENNLFEVRGYLWIENYYCLHLSINTFLVETDKMVTSFLKEFNIQLYLDEPIIFPLSNFSEPVNPLIINKEFAQSFISQPGFNLPENDSWINYNQTYIKLGAALDGIYRINYDDLIDLGINVSSLLPSTFSLYYKGSQLPIYVFGEEDNTFDPGDYIEFAGIRNMGGKHREINQFGEPYNEYLDRYSDTSSYWLTFGGVNGLRANISSGIGSSVDTLKYYYELIHYERNNWFDFSMADLVRREMPYWYENKTWHEGNLGVGTRNLTFTVSNVYPDHPFYVFSKQQSFASSITANAHLLAISVNSLPLQDSGYVNKYQQKLLQGVYNSNSLNNGNNILRIHSFATNANPNLCIYDWYEVEYPRYLRTYNDSLLFSFPFIDSVSSVKGIKVTNVVTDSFAVWKYGDDFMKYNLTRSGNEVIFFDTVSNKDKFILIDVNKIQKPKIYYAKQFKNLRSSSNQADYLAITHKKFLNKSEEYASFISGHYGVSTKVIDIDDIYDEYGYGFFNPEVIRDFLKSTQVNWQNPLPKYVTLIGQATYDYHANKTKFQNVPPKPNYVPSFGASVSDNWFVTWDTTGAYIPQMNIGRIPVKSVDELSYYMNKHINYVSADFDAWNKKYMFFSGGTGNNQAQLDQLREANQFVINNHVAPAPTGGNYSHFYKTINPNTNFGPYTPEEIQRSINEGAVFISYLGHSGTQTWDNSITQPVQLKNNVNRNPLISDFGCSTARFAEPDVTSFSQLFVLDNDGQAIAYVGNSSLGLLSTSLAAPKIFYRKILVDSVYNISEAHKQTKLEMLQNFGSSGVYQLFALTNTLIGDPIVNLPIPPKPNLSVSTADIIISTENPVDMQDSISVSVNYYNYGKVTSELFTISVKQIFNDSLYSNLLFQKTLPKYQDSLFFYIPIKNLPGAHILLVELDSEELIDELTKEDNIAQINFIVASSSIRTLIPHQIENQFNDELLLLNPVGNPLNDLFQVEFSLSDNFEQPISLTRNFDTFYSRLSLSDLATGKRYWFRSKLLDDENYGGVQSFFYNNGFNYLINDSISYSRTSLINLQFLDPKIVFDTSYFNFLIISAGFNDGNSAVIQINDQNYIPENTLRGHHVCTFIESSFEFVEYRLFDLLGGGATATNNYINYLESIPDNYIVVFAVSDEGRVTSVPLKNKIKEFGSIYIDSLVFRGSWAMIGKKGAVAGSVPEGFTIPFGGRVEIDTTIYKRFNEGHLVTSTIGPVGKWDSLYVVQSFTEETSINYKPLVIKEDGTVDTLDYLNLVNNYADLSFVNAGHYPKMKILAEFTSDTDTLSPQLYSLEVKYATLPEIGVNYQTVGISRDTIIIGDTLSLNFYVVNAGETSADSFNVRLLVQKANNTIDTLENYFVNSLGGFQKVSFSYAYQTIVKNGPGSYAFQISIDPENKIRELYKDNNLYRIPFVVLPDTVTSISTSDFLVTFDGTEIFDGDYISDNPQIIINLNYPTWFNLEDTTSVQFFLNGVPFAYSFFEKNYDTVNRTIEFLYQPQLIEGEYLFRIFTKNVYGQLENSPGFEKLFLVSNSMKVMNVFNYPNPFKDETHFTFRLTQIPDELSIKIFTVAGRLIKVIDKTSAELNMDFNKIYWDGRDEDGDPIANGVYLYRVTVRKDGNSENITQKLAVLR